MIVYEVTTDRWPGFLDGFAKQYRGRPVCLETFDQRVDATPEPSIALVDHRATGHQVTLHRIAFNGDDSADAVVSVSAPDDAGKLEHHLVRGLSGVRLEQPGGDQGGTLRLDARQPASTFIRFADPVIPGHLDGLAPREV